MHMRGSWDASQRLLGGRFVASGTPRRIIPRDSCACDVSRGLESRPRGSNQLRERTVESQSSHSSTQLDQTGDQSAHSQQITLTTTSGHRLMQYWGCLGPPWAPLL
eukprot:73856-Pyramimonas_sp.AAC.1